MIDIATVRAAYPAPRSYKDNDGSNASYCVGGALCLYAGIQGDGDQHFPHRGQLALALGKLNPQLNFRSSLASRLAFSILYTNDHERYEEAWEVASQALEWRPYQENL